MEAARKITEGNEEPRSGLGEVVRGVAAAGNYFALGGASLLCLGKNEILLVSTGKPLLTVEERTGRPSVDRGGAVY